MTEFFHVLIRVIPVMFHVTLDWRKKAQMIKVTFASNEDKHSDTM